MKDSFKAMAHMGRGNSCYTKAVDTEHWFFQQRRGQLVPRYDKWLNLWYRVRGKSK